MIGGWYSRQQLTNYEQRLSGQNEERTRCSESIYPIALKKKFLEWGITMREEGIPTRTNLVTH